MPPLISGIQQQSWQVVIQKELAAAASAAASDIGGRLKDTAFLKTVTELAVQQSPFPYLIQTNPPGISSGNAGLAILFAMLDTCFPEEGWDAGGHQHIQLAARSLEANYGLGCGLSLFTGLSGMAFATWCLSHNGTRYQKLLAALEQHLLPAVTNQAQRVLDERPHGCNDSLYDVITGLTGMGAYLLCRREEPAAAQALQTVLASLVYLTEEQDGLPHWHVPAHMVPREHWYEHYPDGYLNCGLAHGIPGPLALLSQARRFAIKVEGIDEAITRSADWLIAHYREDEWGINWPVACPIDHFLATPDFDGNSRTAWCYGTPGVARALWLAGMALDRPIYRAVALNGMRSVYRQPLSVRRIDSPTFCHGIAGLLHITLRFANESGEVFFHEAARALTEQLLELYQPETLLGYLHQESPGISVDHPWLLDGVAGVALVLLAAAQPREPIWDRLFLLS